MLDYAERLADKRVDDEAERLRDRAFLLALVDTGLRVHEACQLRRGDLDWNEGQAVLIGKGDKQAVIRFSTRSLDALWDYLSARATSDGAASRPLGSLPLFVRHDPGAKQGDNQYRPMITIKYIAGSLARRLFRQSKPMASFADFPLRAFKSR